MKSKLVLVLQPGKHEITLPAALDGSVIMHRKTGWKYVCGVNSRSSPGKETRLLPFLIPEE
jgi:hypothetical protein